MEEIQNKTKAGIYYKNFYSKNHDKILEKHKCEFCGGSFSYFTKSQHKGSLKCILAREGEEAYMTAKLNKMRNNKK